MLWDSSALETDISGSRSTADLIISKTNQTHRNGLPADTEGIRPQGEVIPQTQGSGVWRTAEFGPITAPPKSAYQLINKGL